jgi:hypothetical protein
MKNPAVGLARAAGYDGRMTRDEAIKAAKLLAAGCDVQLGRCIYEHTHPRRPQWVLLIETNEDRPEWLWRCKVNDAGYPQEIVAVRFPPQMMVRHTAP